MWPYAVWAGFSERVRDGNKFIVAEKPLKQVSRKYCAETYDRIIEERKSRRESASNGFFEDGKNGVSSSNLLDSLFPDEWLEDLDIDLILQTIQRSPLNIKGNLVQWSNLLKIVVNMWQTDFYLTMDQSEAWLLKEVPRWIHGKVCTGTPLRVTIVEFCST